MLRAWQLVLLRFAVTREQCRRTECYRHRIKRWTRVAGRKGRGRNSASSARPVPICARPSSDGTSAWTPYCANILPRIEDVRLRNALVRTVEMDQARARRCKNGLNKDRVACGAGLRPARQCSAQCVLINRSACGRTRAWRAIWGQDHAYNDLPAGISSPGRTRLETGRPAVRCRLCAKRISATQPAFRCPNAHLSGSCSGLAQRACDPYLVRLIQANAV